MRLENIKFEESEEGALPSEITVTMSLEEAATIAKVFGGFNDKALRDKGLPRTNIYNDLCDNVFNRYWEDGLDGVKLTPA